MKVNVIVFGQLTDITGSSDIILHDVGDTDALIQTLHNIYPALADSKYAIALEKKIIAENTPLTDNNTIGLLPPFSGG